MKLILNKFKFKKKIKKIILIILTIIVISFAGLTTLKTFVYPYKHSEIIKEQAAINNLDPYLVLAIIKTESGFDTKAISKKQAKGLMQIMDSTANEMIDNETNIDLTENNIYNVDTNITLGCRYFKSLIDKYNGNYYLAICAYNAGMGNVDKWLKEGIVNETLNNYNDNAIPFKETKNYLKKVITSYEIYRVLYK